MARISTTLQLTNGCSSLWLAIQCRTFLNDLSAILLRFRQHSFAFSADIEKAFLHVFLDETDRDDTRFLWLSDPNNPSSPFDTYCFKVVSFALHLCWTPPSSFTWLGMLLLHLRIYSTTCTWTTCCLAVAVKRRQFSTSSKHPAWKLG